MLMLMLMLMLVLLLLCVQAAELSGYVQSHGDLGCRAPQPLHLEEGLNADSSLAADFWSLLGGRRQYRGGFESHPARGIVLSCGVVLGCTMFRGVFIELCWAVPC